MSSRRASLKHERSASTASSRSSSRRPKSAGSPSKAETRSSVHATSFGLELEFVFAFKEDLLQHMLSKYNLGADIIKTLTADEHQQLVATEQVANGAPVPAYDCRTRTPSWALHVPETDLTCQTKQFKGMGFIRSDNGRMWVRRYVMEPLLIARDLLGDRGLGANVVGWVEPHPEWRDDIEVATITFPDRSGCDASTILRRANVDYTKWTLTNDHTLVGALPSQLHDHLRDRGVPEDNLEDWDSHGMEMISPIFSLNKKSQAFAELGRYVQALSEEGTSALGSVWSSAHVHIGFNFDKPKDMPILLLQHLAYILVLHEDLISKCHPRSRCGVPIPQNEYEEPEVGGLEDDEDFDPDNYEPPPPPPTEEELERENEQAVLAFEAAYTGVQPGAENVCSNARYLRKTLASGSLLDVKDAIFKQDGDIFDLVDLLQHRDAKGNTYRGYMYNFANLVNLARNETSWKSIKPTVEFRQHACTTDPAVLECWVTLLEAIICKTDDNAARAVAGDMVGKTYTEQEASKYPTSTEATPWPCRDMRTFCTELLGLNENEAEYWQGRFNMFKDDRP
ncbi:hypothetical protein G647_01698 [Cladophialophora carrionii CBS 160.54]|uniref:Amidoligase enzyme n=1 Tax=Cladophialophora carrionii CBS 160.54 TaxID=1279043 RepID=V9DQT0_9EURO|nr:uncharacterized protein G647_01698 [Cladophialophora carrionii CBS 160.54]ETI29245.1 hypothetical protein G647_01698 [Cladophialophora carrionii CBS 160.54]